MWQALGALLPIATAVAFSSVPVTAMILILLSPRRRQSAVPFLIGSVIGIALAVTLATLFASVLPKPPRRAAETWTGVAEIILGIGLIAVAVLTRKRGRLAPPAPGSSPDDQPQSRLQRLLGAIASFGPLASFGVALALGFRPKGLLLALAAGLALHAASLEPGEEALMIVVYTALGASTLAVPIIATAVNPQRVEPKLIQARDWLSANGGLVTSLVLFMLGVVIVGDGLTQL